MARKQDPEFEMMLPGMEPEGPGPPRRRSGRAKDAPPAAPKKRYWLASSLVVLSVMAALYGFQQVERMFIRDPRFALEVPEPGEESAGIALDGASRASRAAILNVFANDYGRSVYLIPLAERRRNLLAVEWVRDASVSRVWPNHVHVRVSERQPVAVVQLPSGNPESPFRFALIDADGVILEPQARVRYELPVLTGIRQELPENVRRDRVKRAMRLVRDIGPMARNVSEIDVADADNLKITHQVGHRVVMLVLGNQRFRQRLENFLDHYDDIRRRMPDARTLDLRLEDRITAVQGVGSEQ